MVYYYFYICKIIISNLLIIKFKRQCTNFNSMNKFGRFKINQNIHITKS